MALKEQVLSDMKEAMKAKDSLKLGTIRMLQSAIKNKEIELRPNEISDNDILDVIKKLVKQRKESIEQFQNAGRTDLVEKEEQELSVLNTYMPEPLSEAQTTDLVMAVIKDLAASSMKDMGAVMKEVVARSGGAVDNKIVSQLIKSKLQ